MYHLNFIHLRCSASDSAFWIMLIQIYLFLILNLNPSHTNTYTFLFTILSVGRLVGRSFFFFFIHFLSLSIAHLLFQSKRIKVHLMFALRLFKLDSCAFDDFLSRYQQRLPAMGNSKPCAIHILIKYKKMKALTSSS